jgi:hypothetical protein
VAAPAPGGELEAELESSRLWGLRDPRPMTARRVTRRRLQPAFAGAGVGASAGAEAEAEGEGGGVEEEEGVEGVEVGGFAGTDFAALSLSRARRHRSDAVMGSGCGKGGPAGDGTAGGDGGGSGAAVRMHASLSCRISSLATMAWESSSTACASWSLSSSSAASAASSGWMEVRMRCSRCAV